jgi:hypothetical protein
VVALFFVVPDTDDTERLNGTAPRAVVDASLELDFTVDVDDVAVKIVENVLYLLSFEGNGVATPFSEFSRDLRICVGFESCEKPAAVGVDQIHRAVIEVGLIEQQQRVLHPWTSRKLCEFMRARVSDGEFSRETATDGFDHVELRSSVVVAIAGKRLK